MNNYKNYKNSFRIGLILLLTSGLLVSAHAEKKLKIYNAMDTGTIDNDPNYTLHYHTVVWNKDGTFRKDQGIEKALPGETVKVWDSQVKQKTITVAIGHSKSDVEAMGFVKYPSNVTVVDFSKSGNSKSDSYNEFKITQQGDYNVITTCGEHHDKYFLYVYPRRTLHQQVTFDWKDVQRPDQEVHKVAGDLQQRIADQHDIDPSEIKTQVTSAESGKANAHDIKLDYQQDQEECGPDNNYCVDPNVAEGTAAICDYYR